MIDRNGENVGPSACDGETYVPLLKHVAADEIPDSNDLLSSNQLADTIREQDIYSILLVGDVMIAERARRRIKEFGVDYPFAAIRPLLQRSRFVVGNLEAPISLGRKEPTDRYSYRMDPDALDCLKRAGFSAFHLANNHLMDCGRQGVCDTLDYLKKSALCGFGAGIDLSSAEKPLIIQSAGLHIGFLGYYWNERCAAGDALPGTAVSDPIRISAAVKELRPLVDWLIVSFHWGVPYTRSPSDNARYKARLAIESGADLVVGHHPHVIQPLEFYQGKPVYYSIGNCLMGSGNSKAEGLALAIRFNDHNASVDCYPLYVKNRDPRINYQTKVLTGRAAANVLRHLSSPKSIDNGCVTIHGGRQHSSIS